MGKKYIEDWISNKPEVTLEYILKKICIDRDERFLFELIHDLEVYRIINQITNRYGFAQKKGFLISKDVIKGIVTTELMWTTWHDYNINRYDDTNNQNDELSPIGNSYLTFVWKIVPLRVKTQINIERPKPIDEKPKKVKCPKSIVNDYYDKRLEKEHGVWNDSNYDDKGNRILKPGEVLSGNIYKLEILSDEIQESKINSNYGNDFKIIDDDYKFDDILENAGLTDKQIDVITKIYKDGYSLQEIAEINGNIKRQSVNDIHKAALRKLRNKYKITLQN